MNFFPVLTITLILTGCSSKENEIPTIENKQELLEQQSAYVTLSGTNDNERQTSSSFVDLSIKTNLLEDNYNEIGPAPRESSIDLSLAYYQLSGDVSTDFLKEREEFFDEIAVFQSEKKQSFVDFLQSDYYNDLDSVVGWNNESHHSKEYIERNDMLIFSSLVVNNGTYGGPGYCDFKAFNYDIQIGKELTLADVVNDYDLLKSTVVDTVTTNPPSLFYSDNPDYIGSFIDNTYYNKEVSDYDKVEWTLDEDGLTIYYSKTQIGDAYICTIPYSDSCIDPSYRLIEGVDYNSEYQK